MKRIAFIFALLMASPAWSAISFVQAKSCHITSTAASGYSLSCLFDTPPTRGNMFTVGCAGNGLGGALKVTDDQSDAYTLIGGTTSTSAASGGTLEWGISYSSNVLGDFTTITCTDLNSNVAWLEMSIHEYSGAAVNSDPFDISSSSSATVSKTTTTVVSGYVSTTSDNELVFAFSPKMTSPATAGNGTIRTNDVDNAYWSTEDAIIPVAGVYQSSFTFASALTTNWMSQATFRLPLVPPPGSHTWQ